MDPASAYTRRMVETASPIGLIVLLFQRATLALQRAADAMDANDIETRTRELTRALEIIAELKSALNHEKGGEVAAQFEQFYVQAERVIVRASARKEAQPLRELCEHFVKIRDAWQTVDARPNTVPTAMPMARPNTTGEVRPSWKA